MAVTNTAKYLADAVSTYADRHLFPKTRARRNVRKAQEALGRSNLDSAQRYAEQALRTYVSNPEAHAVLCQVYERSGDLDTADSHAEQYRHGIDIENNARRKPVFGSGSEKQTFRDGVESACKNAGEKRAEKVRTETVRGVAGECQDYISFYGQYGQHNDLQRARECLSRLQDLATPEERQAYQYLVEQEEAETRRTLDYFQSRGLQYVATYRKHPTSNNAMRVLEEVEAMKKVAREGHLLQYADFLREAEAIEGQLKGMLEKELFEYVSDCISSRTKTLRYYEEDPTRILHSAMTEEGEANELTRLIRDGNYSQRSHPQYQRIRDRIQGIVESSVHAYYEWLREMERIKEADVPGYYLNLFENTGNVAYIEEAKRALTGEQ